MGWSSAAMATGISTCSIPSSRAWPVRSAACYGTPRERPGRRRTMTARRGRSGDGANETRNQTSCMPGRQTVRLVRHRCCSGRAEDKGFEPSRACTQHAFQVCGRMFRADQCGLWPGRGFSLDAPERLRTWANETRTETSAGPASLMVFKIASGVSYYRAVICVVGSLLGSALQDHPVNIPRGTARQGGVVQRLHARRPGARRLLHCHEPALVPEGFILSPSAAVRVADLASRVKVEHPTC